MIRIASILMAGVAGLLVFSACVPQARPIPAGTMQVVTVLPEGTPGEVTPAPATNVPAGTLPGGMKTVTISDSGQTIPLVVGESFLLILDEGFTWEVSISAPDVLVLVENDAAAGPDRSVYQALRAGTAVLTAAGDPLCLQSQPPCGMPSILVEFTVLVR